MTRCKTCRRPLVIDIEGTTPRAVWRHHDGDDHAPDPDSRIQEQTDSIARSLKVAMRSVLMGGQAIAIASVCRTTGYALLSYASWVERNAIDSAVAGAPEIDPEFDASIEYIPDHPGDLT